MKYNQIFLLFALAGALVCYNKNLASMHPNMQKSSTFSNSTQTQSNTVPVAESGNMSDVSSDQNPTVNPAVFTNVQEIGQQTSISFYNTIVKSWKSYPNLDALKKILQEHMFAQSKSNLSKSQQNREDDKTVDYFFNFEKYYRGDSK